MREVSASELKELDPCAFEKEYYKWLEYCLNYDWTTYLIDDFKHEMGIFDLDVDDVYWDGSYGWRAAITGCMKMHVLMKHLKMDEVYLPLYLDAVESGYFVRFRTWHRNGHQRVEIEQSYSYTSPPQGVFSGMAQEDWEALVEEQATAEDWEQLALDWLATHTDKLAKALEADYDYLTSEEEFIASCECNDVTFEIEEEDHEV